jgi:capsular exopolysaccharide synthesis family protein
VIAAAAPPAVRSGPSYVLIFIAALGLSGGITVALVLLLERLDNGFRTGRQVEEALGVACLGMIPEFATARRGAVSRVAFAEAVRTVRAAVRLRDGASPPKAILVTSSLPREGKSVFALALARALAVAGQRTLLIDADMRRPSLARTLVLDDGPTLGDVLRGDVATWAAPRPSGDPGLDVIPAARAPDPQELLGSPAMKTLMVEMTGRYDALVIDAPPALLVADALVLSPLADAIIFAARWAETPRDTVAQGLEALRSATGKVVGIVLSRVDLKRHARYPYHDEGYYRAVYGGYPAEPRA